MYVNSRVREVSGRSLSRDSDKSTIAGTRCWVCSNLVVLYQLVHQSCHCRNVDVELSVEISVDPFFDQIWGLFSTGFVNSFGCLRFGNFVWLFSVCGHSWKGFQIVKVATSKDSTLKGKLVQSATG